MNHHNHPSHTHNFFNKHTSWAILILIVGAFFAGYYVALHLSWHDYDHGYGMNKDGMYHGREYRGNGMYR